MNESCNAAVPHNAVGAKKLLSPCDAAYADLRERQDREGHLLTLLAERLGPVLRPQPPTENEGPQTGPEVLSEIHGRFVAAADRSTILANHINDLLDRLTV